MQAFEENNSILARKILAGAWGTFCFLILVAPMLSSFSWNTPSSFVYLFFSRICHQIPERSFTLSGHSLAVCHRCFGIYIGFFLGSLLKNRYMHPSSNMCRLWIIAAIAPMAVDVMLSFTGFWDSVGLIRFSTGLVFGGLTSSLLVYGVAELLQEAPWRRAMGGHSPFKGVA